MGMRENFKKVKVNALSQAYTDHCFEGVYGHFADFAIYHVESESGNERS